MHHISPRWGGQIIGAGLALTFLAAVAGCGKQSDHPGASAPVYPTQTQPDAGLDPSASQPPAQSAAPATQPQARLPQVDLQGLKDLVADAKAHHQVLVMDFWATWCGPCVEMFPGIHQGVTRLGDRARVVSVTLDAPGRFEEHAIQYLTGQDALKGAYLLTPDTDARLKAVEGISTQWKDLVVPAILVFDSHGRLRGQFIHNVDVGAVLNQVKALLASSKVDQP